MDKRFLATIAIISALISFSTLFSPLAKAVSVSPKVQQVIEFAGKNQHTMAEDALKDLTTKEKDELVQYIEANYTSVPPLYYIKMADHVLKTDKDKAALWFYIGKVRAYEDVMMCKDKTAQSQLDILQYFAPKTTKYIFSKNKDKSYMADLLQKVLDWDISHKNRTNPIWACYQGISASTKTPELKSEDLRQKVLDNVRDELNESIMKYKKLD